MKNNIIIKLLNKLIILRNNLNIHNNSPNKQFEQLKINKLSYALKQLKNLNYTINLDNLNKLNIDGVGKKTKLRIKEILKTNNLSEIDKYSKLIKNKLKNINFDLIVQLDKIFGININKATKLINKYNINSIDDFVEKINNNIISNKHFSVGIKYYKSFIYKIPYNVINDIQLFLTKNISYLCHFDICGSYRRKQPFSNDIDLLIIDCEINIIVSKLKECNFIIDDLNNITKYKYNGYCKFNNNIYRIDIQFTTRKSYYTSLIYFTGSKDFNIKLRIIAKKNGFKLNEYGLFKKYNNKFIQIDVNSEKHLFELLNIDYIEPHKR